MIISLLDFTYVIKKLYQYYGHKMMQVFSLYSQK